MSGKRSTPRRARGSSGAPIAALARTPLRAPPSASPAAVDPLLAEVSQAFFELLMRHRTSMRDAIVDAGLSPPLVATLHLLGDAAMTMRELAETIGLEPSNLTGIVDRLEARGFVERQSSPDDRRIKKVSLTRAGLAMRKRLLEHLKQPTPWMLLLTKADLRQLLAILRKVLQPTAAGSADAPSSTSQSSRSRR